LIVIYNNQNQRRYIGVKLDWQWTNSPRLS
jgi:hypothetical protein